jgi:hypothetical protein
MMKLPMGFHRIVPKGLYGGGDGSHSSDYTEWVKKHTASTNSKPYSSTYRRRAYARVGLAGNPSNGFFGKTLSLSIANFWAEVMIQPSEQLCLRPHHLHDPTEFGSLADLCKISQKEGYVGGLRLLQACCKKFFEYCSYNGIALPRQSFTLSYDTNVPRQVGLAGSSAIVTACVKSLMAFYGLGSNEMSHEALPSFIMSVETEELKINAGLQDRVIQVYEGIVYMDFDEDFMRKHGYGQYERLGKSDPAMSEDLYKLPLRDSCGSWDRPEEKNLSPVAKYRHLIATPDRPSVGSPSHLRGPSTGSWMGKVQDSPRAGLEFPPSIELPPFWLGYLANPSDSGKIHKNVKQLWLEGDAEVRAAMKVRSSFPIHVPLRFPILRITSSVRVLSRRRPL